MERLIREIRLAKKRGVKVDEVFVDEESRLKKLEVQLFGLKCSIVFTFLSPLVLYGVKLFCAVTDLKMDLPETAIMNFCLVNAGSMVAFGFGSSVHAWIKEIRRGKDEEEIVFIPGDSGRSCDHDGDSAGAGGTD